VRPEGFEPSTFWSEVHCFQHNIIKLNKIKAKKSASDIVKLIDETVKTNIKPTDIESVSVVVEKPKPSLLIGSDADYKSVSLPIEL